MEVFALHLEVNQRLQEVASFKRNKYFPEEIDLALNKAQYRLLEKGVETDFQDDQVDLSTVSGLIQTNRGFDLIIPGTNDLLYETNILNSYTTVPSDLYWTINTRMELVTDPLNCEQAPNLATTNIVEYVAVVGYPTVVGNSPYFPNLTITDSVQGTLYTLPSEIATGVQTIPGKYFITQNVVEAFYRNRTTQVFWERYRDTYQKGKFFIVSNNPLGTVTISATGYTSTSAVATQTTYSIFNRGLIPNLTSKSVKIATSRIEQQDTLYQSLYQNEFYNTSTEEPIISQTLDYFVTYRDKSFIISKLNVDYIRKPRTISLSLNQTCELAESTHPKLIDLAVEILRLDTKDQAYPASVQDTELRS